MGYRFAPIILSLALLTTPGTAAEKGLTIKAVRSSSYPAFTRVVFEVVAAAPYALTRSQDGRSVRVGSYEGPLRLASPLPVVHDGVIAAIEAREEGGRTFVVVRLDAAAGDVKDFTLRGPDRIVLDIAKAAAPTLPKPAADRQLVVVLDPGHGGRDAGVLTAQGLEKVFDLELSQAVRNLLQKDEHLKVVLTREKDQALSLDERAALANAAGAAVFVSIHGVPGLEERVYIQDVSGEPGTAAPAKPVSGDFLGFETDSEQQETLWGTQQAAHMQKSGVLGRGVARQLSGVNSAEPLQAPLAGLKAVDAPAVLVEIGMDQDRAKAAESIAGGIERYVREDR